MSIANDPKYEMVAVNGYFTVSDKTKADAAFATNDCTVTSVLGPTIAVEHCINNSRGG